MSYSEILRRAKRLECELADLAALTGDVVNSWDTDHFSVAVDRLVKHAKGRRMPRQKLLSSKEP